MGTTFCRWRARPQPAPQPRSFFYLWLIGVGKFVGSIAFALGVLTGGAWIVRTHPRLGDALAMLFIAFLVAIAGLVCAPKR